MQHWVSTMAGGNAALRLPVGALGLDVDAYAGKRGGLTWAEHCERLGEPPATWLLTSRSDGISGIRLFRHLGTGRYRSALAGGDVDLIHFGLRYAVLPPSLHPEGRTYRLLGPDGLPTVQVPRLEQLPALPVSWHAALRPTEKRPRRRTMTTTPTERVQEVAPRQADAELVQQARELISTGRAKVLRDQRGLTLDEVAQRLNMPRVRVRHLEEGRLRSPRPHQLAAYARLLRVE